MSDLQPEFLNKDTFYYNSDDLDPCLICSAPSKGLHFQVNTCRACAAFFRRSIKTNVVYKCQRGTGNCNLTQRVKGKPICRYCRLKKCLKIGMKVDFMDNNKDINTVNKIENIAINESFDGFNDEIKKIFMKDTLLIINIGNNMTQKVIKLLNNFCEIIRPKGIVTYITEICENHLQRSFFKLYLKEIANLIHQFDYFGQLSANEKFIMYKRFWQIFHHIERVYMTVEYFGDIIDDGRILINNQQAINLNNVKFQNSSNSIEERKYIENVMYSLKNKLQCSLVIPMKKLRITLFEFAYIIQVILWSIYEITELSENIQKIADDIIQKASNELHEYYTRELRLNNYAPRQLALIKLINVSEHIVRDKESIRLINNIFNISCFPIPDTGLT